MPKDKRVGSGDSLHSKQGSYLADKFYSELRNSTGTTLTSWDDEYQTTPMSSETKRWTKKRRKQQGGSYRGTLSLSISALQEEHRKSLQVRWTHLWHKSPRHAHLSTIDPGILDRSFIRLTRTLPRRVTSVLIGLRTGHVPLNRYLHCIKKLSTPFRPHCPHIHEAVQRSREERVICSISSVRSRCYSRSHPVHQCHPPSLLLTPTPSHPLT